MELINAEIGTIGLIQEQADGIIRQIGLTKDQSQMLQIFLSAISKENCLLILPNEFNLTLKNL